MSDENKVVAIEGGGKPNPRLEALRALAADLPAIIEGQRTLATITRARYLAFVEKGFSEAQALELCK